MISPADDTLSPPSPFPLHPRFKNKTGYWMPWWHPVSNPMTIACLVHVHKTFLAFTLLFTLHYCVSIWLDLLIPIWHTEIMLQQHQKLFLSGLNNVLQIHSTATCQTFFTKRVIFELVCSLWCPEKSFTHQWWKMGTFLAMGEILTTRVTTGSNTNKNNLTNDQSCV